MKKMIFPALMAGLLAVSCSKKEAQPTAETKDSTQTEQKDSVATTEKVELTGTFEGKIPCADCPGIETKLTLNEADKTFVLESKYLEKKDGEFNEKGNFELSKDGSCVILKQEGVPTPAVYHITKDAAYLVESEEHKELKEEYKLTRK